MHCHCTNGNEQTTVRNVERLGLFNMDVEQVQGLVVLYILSFFKFALNITQ